MSQNQQSYDNTPSLSDKFHDELILYLNWLKLTSPFYQGVPKTSSSTMLPLQSMKYSNSGQNKPQKCATYCIIAFMKKCP